jgi:VanZ family protein
MAPFSIRLWITLAFMIALLVLSVIPSRAQPGGSGFIWLVAVTPPLLQKTLHVFLYAILTLLWAWTLEAVDWITARLLVPIALAVVFGALMEALQAFIPGRYGTLYDVMLNALGAGAGLIIALMVFDR